MVKNVHGPALRKVAERRLDYLYAMLEDCARLDRVRFRIARSRRYTQTTTEAQDD